MGASFIGWLAGRQGHRARMRARALPVTMQRAIPVIRAIERYTGDRGAPPAGLPALVPEYLAGLPPPGPVAEGGWRYERTGNGVAGGWTLYVTVRDEYSPNLLGFGDRFVYHPSNRYPRSGYGGILVRFGRWGYYVE